MRSFPRICVCDAAQNVRSFSHTVVILWMKDYVSECVLDTRFNSEMEMHLASVLFLKYVGKRALSRAKMQLDGFSPCRGLRSPAVCVGSTLIR